MTWGLNRVALPADIPPGATATFSFIIAPPSGAGNQILQWRMVREGGSWFGQTSDGATVAVGPNADCQALANQITVLQGEINDDAAEIAALAHNSPGWKQQTLALDKDIQRLTGLIQQVKVTMLAQGCP